MPCLGNVPAVAHPNCGTLRVPGYGLPWQVACSCCKAVENGTESWFRKQQEPRSLGTDDGAPLGKPLVALLVGALVALFFGGLRNCSVVVTTQSYFTTSMRNPHDLRAGKSIGLVRSSSVSSVGVFPSASTREMRTDLPASPSSYQFSTGAACTVSSVMFEKYTTTAVVSVFPC